MRDMDQFIAERARHLAIVFLTRRDDLLVTQASPVDDGVDLVVIICENGEPTSKMFGVRVQGRTDVLEAGDLSGTRPDPWVARQVQGLPFPALQIVFSMENDLGWYVWRAGSRQPAGIQPDAWTPLETGELARIVEAVDAWYGEVPGRGHPTSVPDRRIAGVDLPREKRIEIGLTYVFGIGRGRAREILAQAGIDPDRRVHQLSDGEIRKLRQIIETSHKVEGVLRSEIARNIKRLMDIGRAPVRRDRRGTSTRGSTRTRESLRRVSTGKKKPGKA